MQDNVDKKLVAIIYLDIETAFDKVPHKHLGYKIKITWNKWRRFCLDRRLVKKQKTKGSNE